MALFKSLKKLQNKKYKIIKNFQEVKTIID